jgi:hypothetical protein
MIPRPHQPADEEWKSEEYASPNPEKQRSVNARFGHGTG